LILKRGILPKWAPKGIISRAESWVIEESDVDPHGKVVKCVTKNLDHVKVLQVIESVALTEGEDGFVIVHFVSLYHSSYYAARPFNAAKLK